MLLISSKLRSEVRQHWSISDLCMKSEDFLKKWPSKLIVMPKCLRTSRNALMHVNATARWLLNFLNKFRWWVRVLRDWANQKSKRRFHLCKTKWWMRLQITSATLIRSLSSCNRVPSLSPGKCINWKVIWWTECSWSMRNLRKMKEICRRSSIQ